MYLCLVSWHRVAKGCSGVSLCFGAMEGFSTLNPNRVLWVFMFGFGLLGLLQRFVGFVFVLGFGMGCLPWLVRHIFAVRISGLVFVCLLCP